MTQTQACPECDSSQVVVLTGSMWSDPTHNYRCEECGAHFDDPVQRESYSESNLHGLAKKLHEDHGKQH